MVPGRCKVYFPLATKPIGFDLARLYEWFIRVAVALSLALPAAAEMMMTKIIEVKQIDSVVELGLDVSRIRTVSYGKEFPFEPGHDDAAWAANRRAHFVITSK